MDTNNEHNKIYENYLKDIYEFGKEYNGYMKYCLSLSDKETLAYESHVSNESENIAYEKEDNIDYGECIENMCEEEKDEICYEYEDCE